MPKNAPFENTKNLKRKEHSLQLLFLSIEMTELVVILGLNFFPRIGFPKNIKSHARKLPCQRDPSDSIYSWDGTSSFANLWFVKNFPVVLAKIVSICQKMEELFGGLLSPKSMKTYIGGLSDVLKGSGFHFLKIRGWAVAHFRPKLNWS